MAAEIVIQGILYTLEREMEGDRMTSMLRLRTQKQLHSDLSGAAASNDEPELSAI